MKNNTSKLALIILSLALLVGAAIGFSASAETAAPEIVSKNINVTGNYCLMLAVDPATVAGDDVTITIYEQLPAEGVEPAQTITKAKTATEKIDLDHDGTAEYDAIVFYTAGVSAKDIADVWYITTTSAGVTSDAETYSVREYAFERLYKNGTVTATETDEDLKAYYQKQFYLELLDVGSAAQQLLVNYGKPEAEKEKLAKEYIYAVVTDGTYTVDGVTASKGFVNAGDVLTLTADDESVTGWNVVTYGKNGGQISTQTVAIGDTLTVSGNTVVVPYIAGVTPGLYFDEIGLSDYNFTGKDWKFIQASNGYMAHTKLTGATEAATNRNYAMYAFEASGDDKYGNVFHMAHHENDYNFAMLAHFAVQEGVTDANCLVFEFDMKFIDGLGCYSDAEAAKQLYAAMIFSWNGADLATVAGKTTSTTETNSLFKRNMTLYDNDGVYTEATFETSSGTNATYKTGGDTLRIDGATTSDYDIAKGEWHNICFEIYTDVNKLVYYVDGNVAFETSYSGTVDISAVKTTSIQLEPRLRNADFMFDNVFSGKIAKEYVAP